MRNWLIGTGLVIGGGVLAISLTALGLPRPTAVGIGVTISTFGFIVQMYIAFSTKVSFERSLREKQQHEALMKKTQGLPPEQAIQLLLKH